MPDNPFDVPGALLTRFRDMGAVRQSAGPDRDPVLFWDADGTALGAFNRAAGVAVILYDGRAWGEAFLAGQRYEPIDTTGAEEQV